MPWQSNNETPGGPWSSGGSGGGSGGSGSGGGSGGGPKSPWGEGPPRRPPPGRGPSGNNDIDAFLRRSQDKLRNSLPNGGSMGNTPFLLGLGAIVAIWLISSSSYRVQASERGIVQRFGRYVETTGPGFHFKLPAPIDTVVKPKVDQVNSIDIGPSDGSSENLMLTGDQNIIDIAYAVRWKIKDPERFLFVLAEPQATIKEVAESAMRSEIGRATLNDAIGPQRAQIAEEVRVRMQELLDSYRSGIEVRGVDIKQADPPSAVDAAFKDVSAAQQDAQQKLNQARGYAQQVLAQAQGATAAFDAVYAQYKLAPEVTRKRMYLETMEQVLAKTDKTIVEPGSVTAYLPLPEVQRRARIAEPTPATPPVQAK